MKLLFIIILLGIDCISQCPCGSKKPRIEKREAVIPMDIMPGLLVQFN